MTELARLRGAEQLYETARRARDEIRAQLDRHDRPPDLIHIESPVFHALLMNYNANLDLGFTRNYIEERWEIWGVKAVKSFPGSGIKFYYLCCQFTI